MTATKPKLPDVDQEVTQEELVRLVERLGHDPDRVNQIVIASQTSGTMRVAVRYVQYVRPMKVEG